MGKLVKISNISQFGNHLARAVRRNLRWSNQLSKDVVLEKAKEGRNVVSIEVTIGSKKKDKSGNPLTGMALAYEYGSGEKATRGSAGKYVITPRLKRALWFYMDNPNPNIPIYEMNGKIGVTLPKVMHPGVAPRPFLRPAIQEVRGRATKELALAIKKNIGEILSAKVKEINNAK